PSQGLIQRTVASLFPNQAGTFDTVPYWISGESSAADALLIGTTVTPSAGDNIVTNATSLYYSTLTFPQIVDGLVGGTVYRTLLTIVNPREKGKTLTITLNTAAGPPVSVQRTIQPFGILRSTITDLFNITSADGWVSVQTSEDYVGGWAGYTDTARGGTTVVQGQPASDSGLI